MSLVISRSAGESIFVGEALMTVFGVQRSSVKLGFQAPREMRILRSEVVDTGPNLLPPEERFHQSMVRRIRSMSPARRERLLMISGSGVLQSEGHADGGCNTVIIKREHCHFNDVLIEFQQAQIAMLLSRFRQHEQVMPTFVPSLIRIPREVASPFGTVRAGDYPCEATIFGEVKVKRNASMNCDLITLRPLEFEVMEFTENRKKKMLLQEQASAESRKAGAS